MFSHERGWYFLIASYCCAVWNGQHQHAVLSYPHSYPGHFGIALISSEYDSFDKIQIPHKPSEEVLTRDHIETQKAIDDMLKDFIVDFKKKGATLKKRKVSVVFNSWAKQSKLDNRLRRIIFGRLKEVADDFDR